jgi:hypothetical protein
MPAPTPSSRAAHETHDALLVSQLASGDQLDPWQLRDAELLVSSCHECASLAADLRTLSRVVAWEPVAPRRRDFRIAPTDAQRLRGSAISRLFRRLTLPQVGSLRPAAFGAMSIGLLFVVAGAVWPETGQVMAPADMAAPASVAAPASRIAPPSTIAPADELLAAPGIDRQALVSPGSDGALGSSPVGKAHSEALEAAPAPESDDELPPAERTDEGEGILELDAATEEAAAELPVEGAARAGPEVAGQTPAAESRAAAGAFDVAGKDAAAGEAGPGPTPAVSEAFSSVEALSPVPTAPVPPEAESPALAAGAVEEGGAGRSETTMLAADQVEAPTTDEGITLSAMLLAVGTILALGGALLLVLTWLVRRSADPLLR